MSNLKDSYYTAADALLEALIESEVSYLFCNLGSDHTAIIESFAKAEKEGFTLPEIVLCPHESVALSAAHGYAMMTGEPQGVFVHTDVGTQNLGGALHNAYRGRIPVFIFAGETPLTMNDGIRGGRNSFVNYLQNVYDQNGIVRQYVKWEHTVKHSQNIKQLVYRGMQLAKTAPSKPVYLTAAREVLEDTIEKRPNGSKHWRPVEPPELSNEQIDELLKVIKGAENPVLITSYFGRKMKAISTLVEFCEMFAIPVVEQNPGYLNFPRDHHLHVGFASDPFVKEADLILAIDVDVPWSFHEIEPKGDVYYIDVDPAKEDIPLWNAPAKKRYFAASHQVIQRLVERGKLVPPDEEKIHQRKEKISHIHLDQRKRWEEEIDHGGDTITPAWLSACIRDVVDEKTIILDETITNTAHVLKYIPLSTSGSYFGSGGTSLGWNGGAAIGAKLAKPDHHVISLTGDGSFLFSIPSSVYWMANNYDTPFFTIIYNNKGWNATKMNYLKWYPEGVATERNKYWVEFDKESRLEKIAEAAGNVYAVEVRHPDEVKSAIERCYERVKKGQSAVLNVLLPPL